MPTYNVALPITGIIYLEIDADSEAEAIEKALSSDLTLENIETWEAHKSITQGNVFYGSLNEAEAELIQE